MKIIITIPAYNEEETIAGVIKEIPKDIALAESIEIIVIDDGSTDNTVSEAKEADRIITFKHNKGLAPAFRTGLETALERGADIIVNIDADGQYNGKEIPNLIAPILNENADITLGNRQINTLEHMPVGKKLGNKMATWVTRRVTGLSVKDAQTGFYTSATTLARAPYFIFIALSATLLPSISKSTANNDLNLTKKYINQSLRYLLLLLIPGALLVSATSKNLISLVYTARYINAACDNNKCWRTTRCR